MISLTCYFPVEQPFFTEIEIERSKLVKRLMHEIHKELKGEKYDVDLRDLVVQGASADIDTEPFETQKHRVLQWLHTQPDSAVLNNSARLNRVYPQQPSLDCLHIIIANPEVKELLDDVADPDGRSQRKIKKRLDEKLNRMSSLPSLSSTVADAQKMAKFLGSEDHSVCLDNVPAAMFSQALAQLQRELAGLDNIDVTKWHIGHAAKLLSATIKFYDGSRERQEAIREPIDVLLQGQSRQWVHQLPWAGDIQPDASWWAGEFPIAILELKNTLSVGGDPFVQAIVDYSKIMSAQKLAPSRGSFNFPVVLIGISGNRMEVGAAVCTDSIYVSRLLSFNISAGLHLSENIVHLARVFRCLSSCLKDLAAQCNSLPQNQRGIDALYPNPTPISGDPFPPLTYRGVLLGSDQHVSTSLPDVAGGTTVLYLATRDDAPDSGPVVVKFASQYGETAHRLLAHADLAPQLHWCRPIIGGLYMIVMDYLKDGKSLWRLRNCSEQELEPIPDNVLSDVTRALKLLHEAGWVFGDLRNTNVVLCQGKAHLVDFDWAGKDGDDRYPAGLNQNNRWHEDVCAHGVMRKEHDWYQLERLWKQLSRPDPPL